MAATVGIVGAGITGLATAYILSSHYKVTIVARDLPGNLGDAWASPWAGAVFHPQKYASKSEQEMQKECFHFYQELAQTAPASGVKIYPMTEYLDNQNHDSNIWYKSLMPNYRIIPSSELPSGVTYGIKYTSLAMNPIVLLPWLKAQLVEKGIQFIQAEVRSLEEAMSVTNATFLVNASGVGARILAGDDEVRPVRGQTMFVKTEFNELVMREGSEYTYVIPRPGSRGVIMGGIKSDRTDSQVDVVLKSDILMRVNRITNDAFKDLDLDSVTDIVGFRPGRKSGLRVERQGTIIHAYGVEGAGYIYSFDIAAKVKKLIDGIVPAAKL